MEKERKAAARAKLNDFFGILHGAIIVFFIPLAVTDWIWGWTGKEPQIILSLGCLWFTAALMQWGSKP